MHSNRPGEWYFRAMKRLLVLAGALFTLSCSISPVVTAPDNSDPRYESCRSAARDYCKHALDTPESQMRACVAKSAFECTSGGAS